MQVIHSLSIVVLLLVAGCSGNAPGVDSNGTNGTTGALGAMGTMGARGLAGATGSEGPEGPAGPQGAMGAPGMAGATGPAGSTGPMGPAGPMGSPGDQGPTGSQGPMGPAGATGPMGPPGAMGAAGAPGAAGANGVLSTRSGLYMVSTSVWVQPNTAGALTASCKKPADILLNGGCAYGANAYGQMLTGSYPVNTDDSTPNTASSWQCGAQNPTSTQANLEAVITCITVP